MIKRLFVILVSSLWLAIPLSAQSNKLIRELEGKRGALQKQISETESILQNTKKDVGSQLNGLAALTGQIEERKRYILAINNDVETIERELVSLNRQLNSLEKDLKEKKKKYEASVQYLYKNKSIEEKLMFIFSAKNLGQTYRRMRYVREYATYQRLQGEEILKKQEQIRKKKAERQQVKAAKEGLLKERENEKAKLEAQEKEKRTLVANLQKKQKGLQSEVNKKRREANQLNARIDRLIAEEIERVDHENIGGTEEVQKFLEAHESTLLKSGTTIGELVRRPELDYEMLEEIDKNRPQYSAGVREQVNINIKYQGYIRRQMKQVEQFKKMENKRIPKDINYDDVGSLRIEAVQKLKKFQPLSIGQASRISGVSPADISVLLVYMEQYGKNR